MTTLLTVFWTTMLFASIAWYAILLVHVGIKGGREIVQMTRNLSAERRRDEPG